jgi:hypothetical protein
MKSCTANRSKEQGGGGVVSRSGFVMGIGFVTRFRFVYTSRFVTGSGFKFVTLWLQIHNFITVTFLTATNPAMYYCELPESP